jgi:DNA repair exonuclease SbcCD nuclease subunit
MYRIGKGSRRHHCPVGRHFPHSSDNLGCVSSWAHNLAPQLVLADPFIEDLSQGVGPGHALDALIDRGYDYWALGHVHAREIGNEDPWIVFTGNLQGRQVRESGPKGAALVTIRNGRLAALEHRVLDVFRWCRIEIPIAGERHVDSVMDRVGHSLSMELEAAEGRPIAARVTLTGPTP